MMRSRSFLQSLLPVLCVAALLIHLTGCGSGKRAEVTEPAAQAQAAASASAEELRQLQALKVHLDSVENRIEALKLDRQLLDERLNTLRAQQDENRRALNAIADRVPGGREAMGVATTPSTQPEVATAATRPGGSDTPPPASPARQEKERTFFGWVMVFLLLLILAAWIGAAVRRRKQDLSVESPNAASVVVASSSTDSANDGDQAAPASKNIPIYKPHASSSRGDEAPSGPPLGTDVPDHEYGNEDSGVVEDESASSEAPPEGNKE